MLFDFSKNCRRVSPRDLIFRYWEISFCVFAVVFFFWLYRGTFSIGFIDEDFAWLGWKDQTQLWLLLKPSTHVYYRPLATNIPYYFLSSTVLGIAIWKILSLTLSCLGAAAIFSSQRDPNAQGVSYWLGFLWLLAPFQSFSAFYLNAFDYALFPFFSLSLLCALKWHRYRFALVLLAGAIFSKEQGLALLLAPLVFRRSPPRWYWAASLMLAAVFLFFHGGFSWRDHIAAGFEVSLEPRSLAASALRTLGILFLGDKQGNWGLGWHTVALVALFYSGYGLIRAGGILGLRQIGRSLCFVAILVSPFFLLPEVVPTNLGGGSWGVILFTLAEIAPLLDARIARRLRTILIAGCIACAFIAVKHVPLINDYYFHESESFRALLESAHPLLEGCTPADRVVLEGLTPAYGNAVLARYAYWAIRAKFPGPRFYLLLQNSAKPDFEIAPGETRMWVEPWRIAGHPRITFERKAAYPDLPGAPVVVARPAYGDPSCGRL